MTPESLRRLLADLPEQEIPHPIDAGVLGEYAFVERARGPVAAADTYPHVGAHLAGGCQRCQATLAAMSAVARRAGRRPGPLPAAASPDTSQDAQGSASTVAQEGTAPEPIEIADAVALARTIEAERDALRATRKPDRSGQVDTRRQSARQRHLLLVETALIRQRLVVRRGFLDRAHASPSTLGQRVLSPKARLLLDDYADGVDELTRLVRRVGRLTADLRRLGDDPHGPARSQSEALVSRGLSMTRDALAVDRRLARLQSPLAGMVT